PAPMYCDKDIACMAFCVSLLCSTALRLPFLRLLPPLAELPGRHHAAVRSRRCLIGLLTARLLRPDSSRPYELHCDASDETPAGDVILGTWDTDSRMKSAPPSPGSGAALVKRRPSSPPSTASPTAPCAHGP